MLAKRFYHGASVSRRNSILEHGLLPDQEQARLDGTGRSGYVYLSQYYAPSYACESGCSEDFDSGLVIEVDLTGLDASLFRPDEDDIALSICGRYATLDESLRTRENIDLEDYADRSEWPVPSPGNLAYKGAITRTNLRRMATITFRHPDGEETPFGKFVDEFGMVSTPADSGAVGSLSDIDNYGQLFKIFHNIVFEGSMPTDLDASRADHYGYLAQIPGFIDDHFAPLLSARSALVTVEMVTSPF